MASVTAQCPSSNVAVATTSVGRLTGSVGLTLELGSGGNDVTFVGNGNGSVVDTVGSDDGTFTGAAVGSGACRVVGAEDGSVAAVA